MKAWLKGGLVAIVFGFLVGWALYYLFTPIRSLIPGPAYVSGFIEYLIMFFITGVLVVYFVDRKRGIKVKEKVKKGGKK